MPGVDQSPERRSESAFVAPEPAAVTASGERSFVVEPRTAPVAQRASPLSFRSPLAYERIRTLADIQAAFPPDYFESRDRFLRQTAALHAHVESHEIEARGPGNRALHVDIALIGSRYPRNVIFHLNGVHGVEAFVGAAIQFELMRAVPKLGNDSALVLVHCLNPYGMAHLQRTTAGNVDLIRNFIPDGGQWGGTPSGYAALDHLINPQAAGIPLGFYPRIVGRILRHGFGALKTDLLRGQYDNPAGLFYGGAKREQETEILRSYINRNIAGADRVFGIDVHSGMGTYAKQTLFIEHEPQRVRFSLLQHLLDHRLTPPPPDYKSPEKETRGAVCDEVPKLFPNAQVDWILQEFGTYNPLRVLAAMRQENFLRHHGSPAERERAAQDFRRTFVPDDLRWRDAILFMGTKLVADAGRAIAR